MGSKLESGIPPLARRDLYEVLNVSKCACDQEIKTVYRKLALKYHPDKNADNPEASEMFKEVAFAYSILSDTEKRMQYDSSGFEAGDMNVEIDLSNLGTISTVFAALISKLGIQIKTSVSPTVLEEALSATVTVRPLPLGISVSGKVDKQCAHFLSMTINDQQTREGIVVRVTSAAQSKFKLLYIEQDASGGYNLTLQDSLKTGKITSAGMHFLHFQVYRMDSTMDALAVAKDPEAAFFKRLEGLQACEISELKLGTHIFAVYGHNYFKTASYTIEAFCVSLFKETIDNLKEVEAHMLQKRTELRDFEMEYKRAVARFQEVTERYTKEKQAVVELLKQRDSISPHSPLLDRTLRIQVTATGAAVISQQMTQKLKPLRKMEVQTNLISHQKINGLISTLKDLIESSVR